MKKKLDASKGSAATIRPLEGGNASQDIKKGSTTAAQVPGEHMGAGLEHTANQDGQLVDPVVKTVGGQPPVETTFVSAGPKNNRERAITAAIKTMEPMDRSALRHKYDRPTTRMEVFLGEAFGKRATGEVVSGIPQFTVNDNRKLPDDHVFELRDYTLDEVKESAHFAEAGKYHRSAMLADYAKSGPVNDAVFRFTNGEVKDWQDSIQTYYSPDYYTPELLSDVLRGPSDHLPDETDDKAGFDARVGNAFRAKFLAKIAKAPIFCNTSGDPLSREDVTRPLPQLWIGASCGIDLDFRTHDRKDTLTYVLKKDGSPITDEEAAQLEQMRNAAFRGVAPNEFKALLKNEYKLDRKKMVEDAVQMKRIYMEAQVGAGVQVPVLVAIGCGVFARWFPEVPEIMAEADQKVMSDPSWAKRGIQGVVYAVPRFSGSGSEPYDELAKQFAKNPPSAMPVVMVDQDGLTIARALADAGFRTSVQNPADSDLAAGEYWENRGPALEEWLALTTGMLLSHHATLNPKVTDPSTFEAVE